MRVYVTYHVHPKRVAELIELARGLGANVAFEAEPDIEVLSEERPDEAAEVANVSVSGGGTGNPVSVSPDSQGGKVVTNSPQGSLDAETTTESEVTNEQVQRPSKSKTRTGNGQ